MTEEQTAKLLTIIENQHTELVTIRRQLSRFGWVLFFYIVLTILGWVVSM